MSGEAPKPSVSDAQVGWLTTYVHARVTSAWPTVTPLLGHTPALQSLAPIPLSDGMGLGVGDLVLRLEAPSGAQILAVTHGPLARGLVGLLLDEDPGPMAPLSPAEAGLLAGVADAALRDLGLEGWGIREVALASPDEALPGAGAGDPASALDAPTLGCVLSWACGPARGDLSLWLNAAATGALWETAHHWQPVPGEPGGDLPLAADLILARTTIPRHALAALAPGDAVVFPTAALPENDWPVEVAVAGRRLPGTLRRNAAGRELEIRAATAVATTDSEAQPSASTALLTAVLGRVALTAAAVSALTPGSMISLDRPVGESVQLLADSLPLGSGELVDVDGDLGVRLKILTAPTT